MAVRAPAPAHPATPAAEPVGRRAPPGRRAPSQCEGRAERWATWVLIYLAALATNLAVGAIVWALGLAG